MKTLNKIKPFQLMLVALLVLLVTVMARYVVWAQGAGTEPSSWNDSDVGAASQPGSAQIDASGAVILSSAGEDIWRASDSFHYRYQVLNGNGQIVARVLGIEGANPLAKVGVMIREGLAADSRNAAMVTTLSGGSSFQWRISTGASSAETMDRTNSITPYWVKIVRNGDWVAGYVSLDGGSWDLVDWRTFGGLASQICVGLVVAAHGGGMTSAVFDQVSIGPADTSEILSPYEGNRRWHGGNLFRQPTFIWFACD